MIGADGDGRLATWAGCQSADEAADYRVVNTPIGDLSHAQDVTHVETEIIVAGAHGPCPRRLFRRLKEETAGPPRSETRQTFETQEGRKPQTAAPLDEKQAKLVAAIEQQGGKVQFDENATGRPICAIDSPTRKSPTKGWRTSTACRN